MSETARPDDPTSDAWSDARAPPDRSGMSVGIAFGAAAMTQIFDVSRVSPPAGQPGQSGNASSAPAASERVARAMRLAATEAVLPRFRRLAQGDIARKDDRSLVTAADLEAEAILSLELGRLLPNARIIGEEACAADPALIHALDDGGLAWIVDPVDGTRAFVEGDPRFGMIVGLACAGRMVAGWLYFPAIDIMVEGRSGSGVTINGHPARPAPGRAEPFPYVGRYNLRHTPMAQRVPFSDLLHDHHGLVADTHSSYEYLRLLAGRPGLYVSSHVTPWDTATGVFLAREAGMAVGYIDGHAYGLVDMMAGTLLYAPDETAWKLARDTLFPAAGPS